jgi:hypothetical protein
VRSIETLVLLSGPLAVGKTAVRDELVTAHGFDYVRSGRYLLRKAECEALDVRRRGLQDLGDELDRRTDYRWLLDDVAVPGFESNPNIHRWIVDAVRKTRQIEHFRNAFGDTVFHAHLTAPEDVLEARYLARQAGTGDDADPTTYKAAVSHENEVASRKLITFADLVVDVSLIGPAAAALKIMTALGRA